MDRINTSTKAVDLFGAGKHGWKNGNLGLGVVPTDFNAEWFNGVQEEKMSVIEGAGVVPAAGVFTQLRQALKRMFGGNFTTVNFANSPFALTADHAGMVLVDATAGNVVINLPAVNVIAQPLQFRFIRVDSTANTATVNRNGVDTFIGGAISFTLNGIGDFRSIFSDSVSKWGTLAGAPAASKPGVIFLHGGTTAPVGSLVCPTSPTTVSRTTYAALFAAIGTTWGAGDGATTFGIPFFPADYAPVQANGNVGTATVGEVISHSHLTNNNGATNATGSNPNLWLGNLNNQVFVNATGGSANLAAGKRVLICVQF